MRPLFLPLLAAVALTACQTTERATDTAAEGVEDAADATSTVARGAADTAEDAAQDAARGAEDVGQFVVDAAGATWSAVTDVFDDDPEADAVALVRSTSASGARAEGTVRFRSQGDDLVAEVSLRGLGPGEHGLHIHENPACTASDTDGDGIMEPAGAAGGHWDPMATEDHGAPTENDADKHLGDLGNVMADADGTVETTITLEGFMPMRYSVAGHAVVVHSGRDDLETDPAGESGTRQGCGVIEGRM